MSDTSVEASEVCHSAVEKSQLRASDAILAFVLVEVSGWLS